MLIFFKQVLGVQFFLVKISIHLALRTKLPKTKVAPENAWFFQTIPLGFFPPENLREKLSPKTTHLKLAPVRFFRIPAHLRSGSSVMGA